MLMTPGAEVNMSVLTMVVGGRGFGGSREAAETLDALLCPILLAFLSVTGIALVVVVEGCKIRANA